MSKKINKEKVIELLEDFHNKNFGNIECDTCLCGSQDFFELIETIKNIEY